MFQAFALIKILASNHLLSNWLELWLERISSLISKLNCFYQHETESLATLTLNSSWLAQMLSDDDKYNKKETETISF